MSEFLVHLGMLQWVQAEFSAVVVATVSLKVLKCYSSVSLLACYSANFKPIDSVHKFSVFWFILYFALISANLNEFWSCFPELWFLIICLLFRKPALAPNSTFCVVPLWPIPLVELSSVPKGYESPSDGLAISKWCSWDICDPSFSEHDKPNYCQIVLFLFYLFIAKTERETKRQKWGIYQKTDTWASCCRCNTNKYWVLQHRH